MKRFTETTKWDDPWFMDLPIKYKLFWLYICDRCDNAGAWEPNMRLVAAHIGEPFELVEILRVFSGRIAQLEGGKLFITKFIPFQYGNLSPNCRAHIPILNAVEKLRVSKGYPKGIHTLMEKEKDMEKNLKKGKESEKGEFADRLSAIFSRRRLTPWSEKECKAFKSLHYDDHEVSMLEQYYLSEKSRKDNICRRDLQTLLNNYASEVDRARAFCNRKEAKSDRKSGDSVKVYGNRYLPPVNEPTEEELASQRKIVREASEKLRSELNR